MSAVLFIGPSLAADEARALFGGRELHVLPPAAQGDVLRAMRFSPRVIGLVDGCFDGVPAVLHKEILHALEHGVAVLGAASMGALRAAELHGFGMRGIGRVFEAFRDGLLTDDGEVALLHGDATHGYEPLSEALVDVRATLAAAREAGVIDASEADGLLDRAATLFYGMRRWPALLAALGERAPEVAARLAAWLPGGRVRVKHTDAVLLVEQMRELVDRDQPPPAAGFAIEPSYLWHDFQARHGVIGDAEGAARGALLDELRLDTGHWPTLRRAALLRVLARREAGRAGLGPTPEEVIAELSSLRARHALSRRDELQVFMDEAGLDERALEQALGDCAVLERLGHRFGGTLDEALLVEAGLQGLLGAARRRAGEKQRRLASRDAAEQPVPPDTLLVEWFCARQGQPRPADLDAYAKAVGLPGRRELLQLLAKEYLYCAARREP